MLAFIEVPATAQLGMKLKDDMRATKDKFDEIVAPMYSDDKYCCGATLGNASNLRPKRLSVG